MRLHSSAYSSELRALQSPIIYPWIPYAISKSWSFNPSRLNYIIICKKKDRQQSPFICPVWKCYQESTFGGQHYLIRWCWDRYPLPCKSEIISECWLQAVSSQTIDDPNDLHVICGSTMWRQSSTGQEHPAHAEFYWVHCSYFSSDGSPKRAWIFSKNIFVPILCMNTIKTQHSTLDSGHIQRSQNYQSFPIII